MTGVVAPPAPSPARPAAQSHLFGATGTLPDAIVRDEKDQRERLRAEALRISGNFYVDRLVGHARTR